MQSKYLLSAKQSSALDRVINKHATIENGEGEPSYDFTKVPDYFLIGVTGVSDSLSRHAKANAEATMEYRSSHTWTKEEYQRKLIWSQVRICIYVYRDVKIVNEALRDRECNELLSKDSLVECSFNLPFLVGMSGEVVANLMSCHIRAIFGQVVKLQGNFGYKFTPQEGENWLGKWMAAIDAGKERPYVVVHPSVSENPPGKIVYRVGKYIGVRAFNMENYEEHEFTTFILRVYNEKKKLCPDFTPGYVYGITGIKVMKQTTFLKQTYCVAGFFAAEVQEELIESEKLLPSDFIEKDVVLMGGENQPRLKVNTEGSMLC